MDVNKRFDQLESLLVDLARKQDQQGEQITQIIAELNRQGEQISQIVVVLNRQGEAISRQEQRLDHISEQIDGLIDIAKISAAAHKESEQNHKEMLAEIREQGRRLDAQGQRQDTAIEAIKLLLRRQDDTSSRVDGVVESQRQIIQLTQLNTESLEGLEPRVQRLEDDIFRKAS